MTTAFQVSQRRELDHARLIRLWLYAVAALVFVMVLVGSLAHWRGVSCNGGDSAGGARHLDSAGRCAAAARDDASGDRYGDIDIRGDSRSDVGACAIVPAIEGETPAGVIQRFQFSVFKRV